MHVGGVGSRTHAGFRGAIEGYEPTGSEREPTGSRGAPCGRCAVAVRAACGEVHRDGAQDAAGLETNSYDFPVMLHRVEGARPPRAVLEPFPGGPVAADAEGRGGAAMRTIWTVAAVARALSATNASHIHQTQLAIPKLQSL